MPEGLLTIDCPLGGLSENLSFGDQEPGTAREYQNVRGLDPLTGRMSGAQRSGLSKYLTSALKTVGSKVQDLITFFVDNRQVTYAAAISGSETIVWDTPNPSATGTRNIKTDRQGNVYALDGNAGIVKYSADGTKLWQLSLPVADTNHVVRALWVDEFDVVYAGVSEGGLQSSAKLWAYEQIPDNKTEQLWEITPGSYIEDIRVAQDVLYTVQNQTDRCKAFVRIYDFIDTANPELTKEWRVPFPVNSVAVKADGSVIIACEPSGDTTSLYWRLPDPKHPNFNVSSEDWTPYQLANFDRRVWAWYVADDIDQTDVASDIEDGVEVLRWRDRTKNLRHLYSETAIGTTSGNPDDGPVLAIDALTGHKGVRFNKTGATSPLQLLRTLASSTIAKEFADQQRCMVPGYTDSQFAIYIVCRPSQSTPDGDNVPRWLWGQDRDNAQSGSDDHILFVNATDTNTVNLPPTGSSGGVYWFTGETLISGGSGTAGMIKPGSFTTNNYAAGGTNTGNFALITLVNDGDIAGDSQDSLFQINGNPIDKFSSRESATLEPSYLGVFKSFGSKNPSNTVSGFLGDVMEIIVLDRKSRTDASQNVLTYDALESTSLAASQTINENTVLAGYLMHRYGSQASLPFGVAAVNNYPHPFGITGSSPDQVAGPPDQTGTAVSSAQALANKRFGAVIKYSPEGKIKWTANEMASGDGSRPGGFGYAVAVNSEGNIYSLGPNPTGSAGGVQQVRMIVDQGSTFSISTSDGAWSAAFASNLEQTYKWPRIDVDEFDNLYIPYHQTGSSAASLRVYKKDGTVLHSRLITAAEASYAVAVDKRIPDYRDDLTTKTVEFVYVAGEPQATGNNSIAKVRLVDATQSGSSPRTLVTMGVSGGDIVKFTTSTVTTPTGGSGALDSSAYIQSTNLFKKAYWTDGRQYRQYDPITDAVTEYSVTSAGEMPSRCQLIESWRGRIVLARSADEPHNWFLSKKDDPNNYDYFPPVPTETDAVAGNNSAAGLCPDIINAVVPYSEDILVFGGDHSIWMLVGDPAAGGRLELVSDITGMAFGRPWCKDPNGILYFFGSMGGIFRWAPGAKPERISLNKIERQLQSEVDLSTHYVRLVYNHRDEGIHILQMPFGAGGTNVSHWFLELKTEAFAKDKFGTETWTTVQPTAAIVIDGDAFDDRLLLFGGEDGFVRKWDRDAKSDDTRPDGNTFNPIDSFVTIFPLPGLSEKETGLETQFSGLTVVLGESTSGARYELFASEAPETLGLPKRMGDLRPGRNPPKWDRVTGPYCGLRLRNAAVEQRWSLERAYIRASAAGLARPRNVT